MSMDIVIFYLPGIKLCLISKHVNYRIDESPCLKCPLPQKQLGVWPVNATSVVFFCAMHRYHPPPNKSGNDRRKKHLIQTKMPLDGSLVGCPGPPALTMSLDGSLVGCPGPPALTMSLDGSLVGCPGPPALTMSLDGSLVGCPEPSPDNVP